MAKLDEILKDPKFADDYKVTFAEGVEFTLGDLRGFAKTERDELEKGTRTLKENEARVLKSRTEIEKAQAEVARLWAELNDPKQFDTRSAAADDPLAVLDTDPLFAPVAKLVRGQDARLAAIQDANEKLSKAMIQLVQTYAAKEMDAQWRSVEAEATKAGYNRDKLYAHAIENKITDPYGIPDVHAAFRQLDAPNAAGRTEAALRAKIEREFEAKYAAQPARSDSGLWSRPSSPSAASNEKTFKPKDPEGDLLQQALDAALTDPDIWATGRVQ